MPFQNLQHLQDDPFRSFFVILDWGFNIYKMLPMKLLHMEFFKHG